MTPTFSNQAPTETAVRLGTHSETNSSINAGSLRQDQLAEPATFYFWRGRVALYALLKGLGIGEGDAVIVPGFTCFAVPSAVLFTGARPIYADIDPATYNVSLESLQKLDAVQRELPIKAIVVQHTFGVPVDLNRILPWARERGIAVIEDCAHVWGSRYRDSRGEWRDLGTFGDAAFFSSQWTKPVSTGLGGWTAVRNTVLAQNVSNFYQTGCPSPTAAASALLRIQVTIRSMLSASWIQSAIKVGYQALYRRGLLVGTSTPAELQGRMPVGYAKRMSSFQRRLLTKRLRSDAVLAHRRRLKSIYDGLLAAAGLPVFEIPTFSDPVLLRYPIRVSDKRAALALAERHHVELGDWYTSPVDRPENLNGEVFAYPDGMCPEGERAGREVVNLPMHLGIDERRARQIVQLLKEAA
ncbi:MAG TPA: DegT/DnrJ/EryC1/StrS family aminotransferase [Candidatus Acidoferrales bacterium]|nr:DegT/DnrJ/EryC1/StrS family aminotransferase [Candidatus Acidoferrales bacterium]